MSPAWDPQGFTKVNLGTSKHASTAAQLSTAVRSQRGVVVVVQGTLELTSEDAGKLTHRLQHNLIISGFKNTLAKLKQQAVHQVGCCMGMMTRCSDLWTGRSRHGDENHQNRCNTAAHGTM